jgi:endonuclease IV
VRQGSVDALLETIRRTRTLEPAFYVFHATGALAAEFYRMDLPASAHAFLLRQFQSNARASVESILAASDLPSSQLAVETVEFPLDLTLELAQEYDLSICFDTGHVLAGFSGEVDFFDALERCLPRLGEVHLHDSPHWRPDEPPLYGQDHKALGQGDLDLSRLLGRLDCAGFQGPIILEMTVDEALASLRQIESVRPDLLA